MGNHRAHEHGRTRPRHGAGDPATASGRRRAAQTSSRLARLRSLPGMLGVLAIAAAGTGAVIMDGPAAASSSTSSGPSETAHVQRLDGTDAVGFHSSSPRERAISRDSERQALADASSQKLQAAAENQAARRNAALQKLGRAAEARAGEILKNQWRLPTTGYHLTARFGSAGGYWSSNHTGLDFAAPSGTPIVAVANGVISETGYAGAYGNQTIETLQDGTEIWYCHQSETGVRVGQKVRAGQQIGRVGSTGNTTGPHLHLEVRPSGGDPVDPFGALVVHGLKP